MEQNIPVAVVIPTYNRGTRVCDTLEKVYACDPRPAEIWVHVDQSDGRLETILTNRFPDVRVLSSMARVGPGGGRHRCFAACTTPIAVSFDDNSYPVDTDFFACVVALFKQHPDAAVIGATIWHRDQLEIPIATTFARALSFTGCGHALLLSAYRDVQGYVPRPIAYGLEETDLSLQLFAAKYNIYTSGQLRVFHDTKLKHHQSPEITECVVANAALFAFLRYPIWLWPYGLLQVISTVIYCLRVGRWRGVPAGLGRITSDCIAFQITGKCSPRTPL